MRKGIIYVVVTCAMPLLMTGCKKNTMSNIAATTETVSSGPDAVVSDTTKQEGFWVVSDKNGIFRRLVLSSTYRKMRQLYCTNTFLVKRMLR